MDSGTTRIYVSYLHAPQEGGIRTLAATSALYGSRGSSDLSGDGTIAMIAETAQG